MSSIPRSSRTRYQNQPSPSSPRALPEPPTRLPRGPSPPSSNSLPSPPVLDRKAHAATRLEPVVEGDARLLREVREPPPGDVVAPTGVRRRGSSPALAKQRSLYFEQAFGSGREASDGGSGIRDRSAVVAEVKTNVFVADEMSFMRVLSEHLCQRYSRPISSIAVTLQHGTCLLLGGSLEPAYVVAIHALPSLVQTTTNKRNAALLQRHLQAALGVVPGRGVVRYVAVPEECLARGGKTVAGELAERAGAASSPGDQSEEKVQRRRTIRTFSRRKPGSTMAQQRQQSTAENHGHGNSAKTESSSPSQDASLESAAQLQRPSSIPPGDPVHDPTPRQRGLRHKRSFTFIQSLFGRTPKGEQETTPSTTREDGQS